MYIFVCACVCVYMCVFPLPSIQFGEGKLAFANLSFKTPWASCQANLGCFSVLVFN